MTKYLMHKHYYILHCVFNDHGKTKTQLIKVPSIDIMYDKFIVVDKQHNHKVWINLDNVVEVEDIIEDLI